MMVPSRIGVIYVGRVAGQSSLLPAKLGTHCLDDRGLIHHKPRRPKNPRRMRPELG